MTGVNAVDDCLFCSIVAGDIAAEIVAESDTAVAFRDVNPQAPLHVLVVPRTHAADAGALVDSEPDTVAELVRVARQVAGDAGHGSYRLVFNTGEQAGQTVFHTHLHVLAGRAFSWPPG
jgi:histidine triad (HIT) family protein